MAVLRSSFRRNEPGGPRFGSAALENGQMDGARPHKYLMTGREPFPPGSIMVLRQTITPTESLPMRKLIIATAALAFLSSTAFAQDKAGSTSTAPAATSGDTAKSDTTKMSKKTKKSKKTAKKTGDDTMQKQ